MKFIKKHILAFAISVLVFIILAVAMVFLLRFNSDGAISADNIIFTNGDESVRLEKGQILKMRGVDDVSVIITGFTNRPCPDGTSCIWSGQSVQYELTENGKKYESGGIHSFVNSDSYSVSTGKSDYETYAMVRLYRNIPAEVQI